MDVVVISQFQSIKIIKVIWNGWVLNAKYKIASLLLSNCSHLHNTCYFRCAVLSYPGLAEETPTEFSETRWLIAMFRTEALVHLTGSGEYGS